MTIYILGMGAMGSLFGAILHLHGHNIVGLCRGMHYDAIHRNGLVYVDLKGKKKIIRPDGKFRVWKELPKNEGFRISPKDWIIITSKVYDLEELIQQNSEIIMQQGVMGLAQNGIGNEEIVFKMLPLVRVYRILTTNGAFLESPGVVYHTGRGYTKIGYPMSNNRPMDQIQLNSLVDCFKTPILSGQSEPRIDVILWEKIFVNIGINAIASINNIPNGELIESEAHKSLMKEAITEAWEIAKALHIKVEKNLAKYVEFTYSVCANTRSNRNSMLQDLDKGRKTEIDFINGQIVKYGMKLGIDTPVNAELTYKIKKLERGTPYETLG